MKGTGSARKAGSAAELRPNRAKRLESSVGGAPGHVTDFFKFTVTPGPDAVFYGLSR
jgi:hypothetical protein